MHFRPRTRDFAFHNRRLQLSDLSGALGTPPFDRSLFASPDDGYLASLDHDLYLSSDLHPAKLG